MNELIAAFDSLLLLLLKLVAVLCGVYLLRLFRRELASPRPNIYLSTASTASGGNTVIFSQTAPTWQSTTWQPEPAASTKLAEPARSVEPALVDRVEEQEETIVCGRCNKQVRSAPVSSDITDTSRLLIYVCEHCNTRLTLPL